VPVFVVFTIVQRRRMVKASIEVKQTMAGINGQLESAISGMRTAKAFANEEQESEKFDRSNDQFKGAKRGYYRAMAVYNAGLELTLPAMNVLTIAAGGYFIMNGQMDFVDLVTFSLYISTFLTPVRKLAAFVEQFLNGMAGFTRFVELMRVEPAVKDAPDAKVMGTAKGDILIDDVSFAYDDGEPVLEHVNIHIPQGETVAVVGPSGGGKSTLCQLIPRFYDVTGGRILVDGQDVRDVQQHSLRQNIGIVQQDVFLFAGTILDNIRYGRPDATEAEIIEAAKKAEIYDDIMAMPDGFQSYVGERGVMLSGGQKQRVSIARIFLKNPPILILDEATSALDSVTEARIQGAFDQLAKGRTTLIIAHRLSTIRNAHRIIVVDDNRIVEEGTHEELLASGGEYASLYNAQKSVSV
jgi:ATP-binding cassette subfamily B protein